MTKEIFAVIEGWQTGLAYLPETRPEHVHFFRYGEFILIHAPVSTFTKPGYEETYAFVNDIVTRNNKITTGRTSAELELRAIMLTPKEHGEQNTETMVLFRTWLVRKLTESSRIVMKQDLKDYIVYDTSYNAKPEEKDPANLLNILRVVNGSTIFNAMYAPGNYRFPVNEHTSPDCPFDAGAPVFDFGYTDKTMIQFMDNTTAIETHRAHAGAADSPAEYWATYSI